MTIRKQWNTPTLALAGDISKTVREPAKQAGTVDRAGGGTPNKKP
jgi:hypothetical protein